MDPTKEQIDLDQLLATYDSGFGYNYANMASSISMPSGVDTVTLTGLSANAATTVSGGGYTVSNIPANISISSGAGIPSPRYSTNASPWLGNGINSDPTSSGKLKLNGEGADVEINGVSLSKTLINIQERLNILTPNPELEKEWEALRELGQQYRELEAKLTEQSEMWTKLKSMPPPPIL